MPRLSFNKELNMGDHKSLKKREWFIFPILVPLLGKWDKNKMSWRIGRVFLGSDPSSWLLEFATWILTPSLLVWGSMRQIYILQWGCRKWRLVPCLPICLLSLKACHQNLGKGIWGGSDEYWQGQTEEGKAQTPTLLPTTHTPCFLRNMNNRITTSPTDLKNMKTGTSKDG